MQTPLPIGYLPLTGSWRQKGHCEGLPKFVKVTLLQESHGHIQSKGKSHTAKGQEGGKPREMG